ncbi:sigma-70 family RNA polymerase sigma factor [Sphingopyxis indica]|uniref:RNA polymerase sigma factor n=1 Tax=Sphingopyxis indica TaxID=436663 RepID=UPI0029393464|nr:sigma-70 family RNA polymerase sigma factor [Sphingopyxis indica]WOF44545.1 sigma-70 family RNA polymerase sigma factor [Sphingopyxis indica]
MQADHLSGCDSESADAREEGVASPKASGDLDSLFRSHRPALLRFVRRKAGIEEAYDIVQDIFVRAAGSQQRHRLNNPAGFLQRIATNLLIDRARHLARRNMSLVPLDEEQDIPSPPQQEWNMEAADLLQQYEDAVKAMPEKTRRVFLMHRVDEMSYREIHQTLGISIATVEYHMMKALAKIAAAVDQDR